MRADSKGRLQITEDDTASALLREASRLVEAALMRMDLKHRACTCCGTVRHDNKIHMQAYNRVTDTPNKLREVADILEAK